MTEPDEVAAPDDTGSDTLARFEYQAHATFPYLLELVNGERVTEVFAEHVEDIAVHEQELWRFLQVKSRDPGRGPWTLSRVVQAGGIRSLWRAYRSAAAFVEATYELLLEGAVLNKDILSAVVNGDAPSARFLKRLAKECGVEVDQVRDFAARLRIRKLPPLDSIVSDNIVLLTQAAPSFTGGQIRQVYKSAVAVIEAAMKANRLEGNWPAALFLDADERVRLRLMAKRFDRDRAEQIFAPILHPPVVSVPFILPQIDVPTFTGRFAELEQLESILLREGGEKVSSIAGISGTGGLGKTALACHFAELHRDVFTDGVIGLRVDGKEPITIARDFVRSALFELHADDERDASALMQEAFRDRRALLIFDNTRDAAIRTLLPGGKRCAVIITTRDRGLPAVLGLPDGARLDVSPLTPEDAFKLLARLIPERVAAEGDAAARICVMVGNLPLAIQIVGATLRVQEWRSLADFEIALREEKERLSTLSVRGDAAFDVRASFSLSLCLLDPGEVEFFASLAVCAPDGFSTVAAAAANDCDDRIARECLAQLFRMSLVNGVTGETNRFVLHPLLRLFAREQAEQLDVFENAESRHRGFFRDLVMRQDASDPEVATLLTAEMDDIVTAAESLERAGLLDDQFLLRLEPLFQRHGYWVNKFGGLLLRREEVREAAPPAADISERVTEPQHDSRDATTLLTFARELEDRADFDGAAAALRRSLSIETDRGNRAAEAAVLLELGGVLQRQGKFGEAVDALQRSYTMFEALHDQRNAAMVLNRLGGVFQRQGKFNEATDVFRESYERVLNLNDARGQAVVLRSLGGVLQRQGDFHGAAEALRQSASIEARLGNRREAAMVLSSLGGVLQRQGKLDEAVDVLRKSLAISEETRDERTLPMTLNSLGGVLQRQGKFDQAVAALRESYTLLASMRDLRGQAMVSNSLGGALLRQGKFDDAAEELRRSHEISQELGDRRGAAMVLNTLGHVMQRQRKYEKAADAYRRSYAISVELLDRRSMALVLNSLGVVLRQQGKLSEAFDAFRNSIAIGQELGDDRHLAIVHTAFGRALLRTDRHAAVDELQTAFEIHARDRNESGVRAVAPILVETLQKLGRIAEAREICDGALGIIPTDPKLLDLRRRLE